MEVLLTLDHDKVINSVNINIHQKSLNKQRLQVRKINIDFVVQKHHCRVCDVAGFTDVEPVTYAQASHTKTEKREKAEAMFDNVKAQKTHLVFDWMSVELMFCRDRVMQEVLVFHQSVLSALQ